VHQVCQIFHGKTYQNGGKYTKWPQNIPLLSLYGPLKYIKIWIFVDKIYHMATKTGENVPNGRKICQNFPFCGLPKYVQIRIFGMKIYHLATLVSRVAKLVQFLPTYWAIIYFGQFLYNYKNSPIFELLFSTVRCSYVLILTGLAKFWAIF
jgi:hypothetical protein